jgi:hypothetical protein
MEEQTRRYSEQDLVLMRDYEQRTGKKIIYTFEEKCQIYRNHPMSSLENAARGISQCIAGRLNIDNADSFDSPDDSWKTKILEENLEAIELILKELKGGGIEYEQRDR